MLRQPSSTGLYHCRRCGLEKSIEDFSSYQSKKFGRLPCGTCRKCYCSPELRWKLHTYEGLSDEVSRLLRKAIKRERTEAQRATRIATYIRSEGYKAKRKARESTEKYKTAKRDRVRKWFRTPKGKALKRSLHARRRARKVAAITELITGPQIRAIFTAFRNSCAYCGSSDEPTLDHFRPLARGGSHTISNLVPACKRCNSVKRDRDPFEFIFTSALARAHEVS